MSVVGVKIRFALYFGMLVACSLLTPGTPHEERDRAVENFQLQKADFETRHKEIAGAFEEGKISLDQYLDRTIFHQARKFNKEEFKSYMFSLSKPKPEGWNLPAARRQISDGDHQQ